MVGETAPIVTFLHRLQGENVFHGREVLMEVIAASLHIINYLIVDF